MRLYLVTRPAPFWKRVYCSTGADATQERMAQFAGLRNSPDEDAATIKKSDITVEQVDVPTDKAGLLAYLNDLVS